MLIKYFCIPFHFKGIFGKIDTVRGLLLVKQAKPSVHRKHLCVKNTVPFVYASFAFSF